MLMYPQNLSPYISAGLIVYILVDVGERILALPKTLDFCGWQA
jgi:hypothetical protein